MSKYSPPDRFNVPMKLLIPTVKIKNGVVKKEYPENEKGLLFFGSFRTFGGTETTINDVYSIVNTATIDTWYMPEIKGNCRILVDENIYEVLGEPENINMENKYIKFKVKQIKGGA